MQKISLSKNQVIELFEKGEDIRKTSGLWNDPLTKNEPFESVEDIESFYKWASMVEVKKYYNDNAYYVHGYSSCDMF